MVALPLGKPADACREIERTREVVEFKDPRQAVDPVELDEVPLGNLRTKLGNFLVGDGGCIAAASDAAHLGQSRHRPSA